MTLLQTTRYKRPLEWWKVVGAFLIVASALMFLRAGAEMFDSWEAATDLNDCYRQANASLSFEAKEICQKQAYYAGIYTRLDQKELTNKQYWILLVRPIAELFMWVIGFVIGVALYVARPVVVTRQAHDAPKKRFRFKSRKKR